MITRTEDPRVFKDWANCDIRDETGKLLKSVSSREEAADFIKNHFTVTADNLFPLNIKVEFNGCVGYRFEIN